MKSKNTLAGIPVGKGQPVRLMGVINVSPESFYKGSIYTQNQSIIRSARRLQEEGADFIDVGALSTAPYLKTQISEKEETKRLEHAVRLIKKVTQIPISIDTSRPGPAKVGLKAGATILNDIHGLTKDPQMPVIAKRAKGVILMANPSQFHERQIRDPITHIRKILRHSLSLAKKHNLPLSQIALDPGIGFFRKTHIPWWKWDLTTIRRLDQLTLFDLPLLVGISRKSFIGHLMNGAPPNQRLPGSLSATLIATLKGASIIRTHDVKETKSALGILRSLASDKPMKFSIQAKRVPK